MTLSCHAGSQTLKRGRWVAPGIAGLGVGAVVLAVAAYLGGVSFAWPGAQAPEPESGIPQGHLLLRVLIALVTIMVVARGLGKVLQWLRQPPVIGEILAGIAIGPSLLGAVSPGTYAYLLPPEIAPYLGIVAQLGIILYMFTVGLKFDLGLLHRRGHAAVAISHASIVAPLLLGAVLAVFVHPYLSDEGVPLVVFTLFFGVSMSITAFPVLARILEDCELQRSPLGTVALACAAVDDITAWCLLALVVGVAQAQLATVVTVLALSLLYIGLMLFVVRPALGRWLAKESTQPSGGAMAVALIGVFASGALTEFIGIHALFGAFLWGAIIPAHSSLARSLHSKLEDIVGIVLLPAFFAFAGMRTEIGLISGLSDWMLCALIIGVASLGKMGGSAVAARVSGMSWRDSSAIGILMNTRGLMELIVLNVGLDLGVISPRLYTLMVIMALVTTVITTPVLRLLGVRRNGQNVDNADAVVCANQAGEVALNAASIGRSGAFHELAQGKI